MDVIASSLKMQRLALRLRREGRKIVLVPTMGALHEGHLSLVRRAKKLGDVVVVSLYVNPTQFGPKEDFSRYPRPRGKDLALCREAGVNLVFAPSNLYEKDASTKVVEEVVSEGRCGGSRPGHFSGVATVVVKLFQLVQPEVAVFGQKDAQQCDVVERVVRDLNVPVRLVRAPIVRDRNGLALSSRNAYLSKEEYETALHLPRTLRAVKSKVNMNRKQRVSWAKRALSAVPGIEVDYVELAGNHLCAAIRVGRTRLIDNVRLPRVA
jgi:pantoate--beta-alanine ligase